MSMSMTLRVTFDDLEKNKLIKNHESKEVFREKILKLQDCMIDMKENHIEPKLDHFFAPGMYARQMTIEAGTTIVGKIHRHAHVNIISKGRIEVSTEFGRAVYEGPYTFVSEPGTKRCVHAITDTIWTTIHAVESEDLEEIEKQVIAEDYNLLKIEGGIK